MKLILFKHNSQITLHHLKIDFGMLDPNAGYYGQPGYPPPQQPYPGAYPGGGSGYPQGPGGYPPGPPQPGFVQPPPYAGMPPPSAQGDFNNPQQQGKHEHSPINRQTHGLCNTLHRLFTLLFLTLTLCYVMPLECL